MELNSQQAGRDQTLTIMSDSTVLLDEMIELFSMVNKSNFNQPDLPQISYIYVVKSLKMELLEKTSTGAIGESLQRFSKYFPQVSFDFVIVWPHGSTTDAYRPCRVQPANKLWNIRMASHNTNLPNVDSPF